MRIAVGIISASVETAQRAHVREHILAYQRLPVGERDLDIFHRFVVGTRGVSERTRSVLGMENDVLLLPRACDSGRCLSAKVIAWFRHAIELTAASFYLKMDPDTFVLWPGLASVLLEWNRWGDDARHALRPIYGGRIMWSSFYRNARRWCGCCAGSSRHAELLHSARAPNWPMGGACVGPNSCLAEGEAVDGPYPYAIGPLYLMSHALVAGLAEQPFFARLSADLIREAEMDSELEWIEDVLLGWCVHQQPNVTIMSWPHGIFHNLDERVGADACRRARGQRGALRPLNLSRHDGSLPQGGEKLGFVGPASVVVHHVRGAAQWTAVEGAVKRLQADGLDGLDGAGPGDGGRSTSFRGAGKLSKAHPCGPLEAMHHATQSGHVQSWSSAGTSYGSMTEVRLTKLWPRGRIVRCNKTHVGSR
jgi:hypothetical protein